MTYNEILADSINFTDIQSAADLIFQVACKLKEDYVIDLSSG